MEPRRHPHPPIPALVPHHRRRHHHHHHHHPLPHFHLPLILLCPCSCPHLLLIPHHHQPHCRLPFVPTTSSLSCPNFSPIPPTGSSTQPLQNPCPIPVRPEGVGSLEVSEAKDMDASACVLQQQEWSRDQELEDEEEDVFVMTDEWMEFFAKSEAKRRLAKQQKKKSR